MPDNPHRVAVLYGPTVLAGELGSDEGPGDKVLLAPALITDDKNIADWTTPVAEAPATFRTSRVGRPGDFTLYPFYRMHHKRYAVYWDVLNEQQWSEREASYKAEVERLRRLEALTVDFVQPGEEQDEEQHDLQGESMETGEHSNRKWRHARSGGWFSFYLKV